MAIVHRTSQLLLLIAVAVLGASWWVGGELTRRYGVRVADEETQALGYHWSTPPRL